jgi:hypothetical protein
LLDKNWLSDHLCNPDITQQDKILIVLLVEKAHLTPKKIKTTCIDHGASKAKTWNISQALNEAQAKHKVKKTEDGWSLTTKGKQYLQSKNLLPPELGSSLTPKIHDLRECLKKIENPKIRDFVEEAIGCLEAKYLRAAIIMSWIGAVSLLYDHVITKRRDDFNAKVREAEPKWQNATNADGLARMREGKFLDILVKIDVLGKSVKTELVNCLETRNGCSHPNGYEIGEAKVRAHIESLILNVYSKF